MTTPQERLLVAFLLRPTRLRLIVLHLSFRELQ